MGALEDTPPCLNKIPPPENGPKGAYPNICARSFD